ncbi:hypothetical protein [Haloferula rosea]|uniref:SLA1 homology domain-containing protein n=1 Tax=Haloferula rosea TaxID=490093 RepID=A0A934RGR9_9BACT|nr:hypothetical protein [Haloferula rosea]MBK1828060.1 hypothetical protein [Haloferula rosea]
MKPIPFFLALLYVPLFGEPTEVREWRSTAGTTIKAAALKVEGGQVFLKADDGREFKVAVDKFADQDRAFLKDHFAIKAPEPGQPTASGVAMVEGGVTYPQGEVSGPIDAGEGSTLFVYVPKTLREGRLAPLMFHTGAGGGSGNSVKAYAEGAEFNGWVIASSVQSRNGPDHPEVNHEHSKRCVEHLLGNLPIDEERVYFTGNSGGGAMSFYNALRIKSAGNMPIIGYSPDKKYEKKQYCYGIGGNTDYNRYLTAHAVAEFGDRGFHRFHPGGHSNGPDWMGDEGITWLNGRYLGDQRKDSDLDAERLDYEASMIEWITTLQDAHPYRAHYWCHFLKDEYEIEGPNAAIVSGLLGELSKEPNNVRYTEGIAALDEFSDKYYVGEGEGGGSQFKHTSSKIEKAAEKLAEGYEGVPLIEDIAKGLGNPTVGK